MSIPDEQIELLKTMLYARGYTPVTVKSKEMKLAIGHILLEIERGMNTPALIATLIDEYLAEPKQSPAQPLLDWNNEPITAPGQLGPESVNPCVTQFGEGPQGKRCKECSHLHRYQQEAVWFKCDLRQWKAKASGTVYPGPDHRANWPACARFEAESNEK